jgi:4'-phosphopantetheinyl transferase
MELPDNEIHLYFCYPDDITDPVLLEKYHSLLSENERSLMNRLSFGRHRHQFLLTRALIRSCLSRYFSLEPGEWHFVKGAYGRPEILHPHGTLPIRFSLSHTNGLIMCGISSECEIGVDVEDVNRQTRTDLNSLSRYFSEREINDLSKLPRQQQKHRFFDYWTLKESYIKARGMGLAIPLDKFSFRFEDDKLSGFSVATELEDDAANWQFWRIAVTERYRVAVAINSCHRNFKLSAVNSVPLEDNKKILLNFL